MTKSQWTQIGAAGGILFLLMGLGAQMLIQVGGMEPAFSAPVEEIMAFYNARNPQLSALGSYISVLSAIPFVWFLAVLAGVLRQYEGEPGWLSLAAFGSGLLSIGAVVLAAGGWELALLRINEGLDPGIARLTFDQGNLGFANYQVALGGLALATGIIGVRDGAFSRWLGWLGIVTGVLLFIGRWFWFEPTMLIFLPYMLFYVWLTATSIALIRKVRRAEVSPEIEAVAAAGSR